LADSSEGYELNEVSWWSNWADIKWLDRNAYILLSKDFHEYFFNRGGFLRVTGKAESAVGLMEAEFDKRKLPPYIFIQSDSLESSLLKRLAERDYRIADQMAVMETDNPSFKVNAELSLEMGIDRGIERWAKVYLQSFYGEISLMRPVMNVLRRVAKNKDVTLVLASKGGMPAGALALFRTPGLLGAYCVGTLPNMRGAHVASTILDFSSKLARNEGRRLILQTILSDSVEPLYKKVGFRRVYLKELFAKNTQSTKSR